MKTFEDSPGKEFLRTAGEIFVKYKDLGDKTFAQLEDKDFHFKPDGESNSIAVLIKHLSGNMISRFTDFLESDGEKPDRNRDSEFEEDRLNRNELIGVWEKGWKVFYSAFNGLKKEDLLKKITIRNEPHSVIEALNRQAAHYSYHLGQIVYLAKQIKKENWKTLSIPKGGSENYNKKKFST